MLGSKDCVGPLGVRSRTQDSIEGPVSEGYIQHWFQEEFLRLFQEDPEFRDQVLKCLLTVEDDESNVEMRKPRRTWFNGIAETQEVSCEEARYLHLCGETTCTDSDLSSEAADEKGRVVLKTKSAKSPGIVEKQAAVSSESMAEDLLSSQTLENKDVDKNQSGILILGNSKVHYYLPGGCLPEEPENPDDDIVYLVHELNSAQTIVLLHRGILVSMPGPGTFMTSSTNSGAGIVTGPFPSAIVSEDKQGRHKIREESLTGPCVHERGTQTWKANPLYLHSNSDSDSNDSWQQHHSSVAWMDNLENVKMLQEVKMRKVKRLEEFRRSRKAEGCNNWRENSKVVNDIYLPSNIQRLPHRFPEDNKAGYSQVKKGLDKEGSGNLPIDTLFRAPPSFICVMPEKTDETTVTSSTENTCEETPAPNDFKTRYLPFVIERKDQATSCVGVYEGEVGDFASASPLEEHKRLHQDLVLKNPLIIVSQDLPFVFLQEDENELLKHTLADVSVLKHKLHADVKFPFAGQIPKTKELVMNENETPTALLQSISPAEVTLTCSEQLTSTVSNISSSALPDNLPGDEGTQPIVRSRAKLNLQCASLTEEIPSPPQHALDAQSERRSPSDSLLGSAKVEDSIPQGQPDSLLTCECEHVVAGEVTSREGSNSDHERIAGCSSSFDDGESRAHVGPAQVPTWGSVTGRETTDSLPACGAVSIEKKGSSPAPRIIMRACRLAAIDEEEQVVDVPNTLRDVSVPRPIARRAAFKPAKNIHWLPPKRKIGIRKTHTHRPIENAERESINWEITRNRSESKEPKSGREDERHRSWKDQMKNHCSRSHQDRIQMWISLLDKLLQRNHNDWI